MDIDGEPWAASPSIGCDEYWPGAVTGELRVSITPGRPYAVVGFPLISRPRSQAARAANTWNFGDGTVVSNRPWASHTWSELGDYAVMLTAYNESNPVA